MLSRENTPALLSACRNHYGKLKQERKRWEQLPDGRSAHRYSKNSHLEFLAGFHPIEQKLIAGKSLSEMALGMEVEEALSSISSVTEQELEELFKLI